MTTIVTSVFDSVPIKVRRPLGTPHYKAYRRFSIEHQKHEVVYIFYSKQYRKWMQDVAYLTDEQLKAIKYE